MIVISKEELINAIMTDGGRSSIITIINGMVEYDIDVESQQADESVEE